MLYEGSKANEYGLVTIESASPSGGLKLGLNADNRSI